MRVEQEYWLKNTGCCGVSGSHCFHTGSSEYRNYQWLFEGGQRTPDQSEHLMVNKL